MASILIKLDTRRANTKGDYPVKLVIVNKQTNAALSLSYYLPEKAWEGDGLRRPVKTSYPGSKLINDRIEQFYMSIRDVIIHLEHSGKSRNMRAADIKNISRRKRQIRRTQPDSSLSRMSSLRKSALREPENYMNGQ